MHEKVGVVLNRLTLGFAFAFIYQTIVNIASFLMVIPLTGTLQDLLTGIEQIDSSHGYPLIAWWLISTVIITGVALLLMRLKKYISPYRREKDLDIPPRITVITAVIVGAIISFLFYILEILLGAIITHGSITIKEVEHTGIAGSTFEQAATDLLLIEQAVVHGNFGPLVISMLFSIIAGYIIIGVIARTGKVKDITKDVGLLDIATLGTRSRKRSDDVKTSADTLGLQPGTLMHIGERKVDKITYHIIEYDGKDLTERDTEDVEDCFVSKDNGKKYWINITGIHDADIVRKLGEHFGIHKLAQADIMNTDVRPKIEVMDDYIFLTLKLPHFESNTSRLAIEQISLVLGKNYVLSFQEVSDDVFDRIRERLRMGNSDAKEHTSDYLAYLLVDALVDNFFVVLEKVGEETEVIEDELMDNPKADLINTIRNLKRQMILLRKTVWPLREEINMFGKTTSSLVSEDTKIYLKDVYSHTIQVMDTIESLRDVIGGMLDTYLSNVSNKMNEVMKTLTIIASIFIPLTFISGHYGMNFVNMPELQWKDGYFAVLTGMIVITALMVVWFKKKDYL